MGVYDVIVGINLLREGLDLPEVGLVAIIDADKEGYLRSSTSLIQTIGRAARHSNGHVIMYADRITDSMERAISETYRRREIQDKFNIEHGIEPKSIQKAVHDITEQVRGSIDIKPTYPDTGELPNEDLIKIVFQLEKQMKKAAGNLEFEKAANLRDQVMEIRKVLI